MPDTLDPGKAVTLILNYLVAYQVLHRVAVVKPGDKVLIVGASGGCETAFLQLGALADLKMYGLASAGKHQILQEYGAIPIDYRSQDFVSVLQQAEPDGIDYVFNGMGDDYVARGLKVLRRSSMLVHYGGPESLARLLLLIVKLVLYKIKGYGTHRLGVELFKADWSTLFRLLEDGQINPIIAMKLPILEAKKAYAMLESGQVVGNIVLLAPELL